MEIHKKCGQIAADNRDLIEDTFTVIKNTALRYFKDQEAVLPSVYSMELAIAQMWQNKRKICSVTSECIKIHTADRISYQNVSEILSEIAVSTGADYIDVTKGNPLLILSAGNAGVPVIAQSPGSMTNILNAPEVRYSSPKKALTVKEMFDLSRTVLVNERDSSLLSDLSEKI